MNALIALVLISASAHAGIFNRKNSVQQRCDDLLDKAGQLAATPDTLGGRVALKTTQDETLAEFTALFDLEEKNAFVDSVFKPALAVAANHHDLEAMRASMIDLVEHMTVSRKKTKRERSENLRQMKTTRFSGDLLRLAKIQPDERLELVDVMMNHEDSKLYLLKEFMLDEARPMTRSDYESLYAALAQWLPLTGSPERAAQLVRRVQSLTLRRLLRERPDFETFESAAHFLLQFEAMSYAHGGRRVSFAATGPAARVLARSVLALGSAMNAAAAESALARLESAFASVAVRLYQPRFRGASSVEISLSDATTDLLRRLYASGFGERELAAFDALRWDSRALIPGLVRMRFPSGPVAGPLHEAGAKRVLVYVIANPDILPETQASPPASAARWIFELARAHGAFALLDAPEVTEALEQNPAVNAELEKLL